MVHRLVAENFLLDSYFDNAVVNHIDGNKLNNNVSNLEWTTQKDNLLDANYRNNQTFKKWNYNWIITNNDNFESNILYGQLEIKNFIIDNKLPCSYTSLLKYKKSKGFELKRV